MVATVRSWVRNISILKRGLIMIAIGPQGQLLGDPGLERRLGGRRVSSGGDDDDDRMMMMIPSARASCRKAKLPTTLMAVRAHP